MAGCESCTFDIGLSLAIVQKGFEKSFNDGLVATKSETHNLITALKEKFTPKIARFDNVVTYELKDGIAYWQGDSMPVSDHLTRNTKLLSLRGAPKELVNQARRDQDVWDAVQSRLSQLKPGQAIQYLSQKDPDPAHGVALQQIVNNNGIIKHESHLLPFNTRDQINKFLNLAGEEREDLSLDSEVSGWIVTGGRIDFDQELPEFMMKSMVVEPVAINWQEAVIPVWPQLTQPVNKDLSVDVAVGRETPFLYEDRVTDVEPSSFWWKVLVGPDLTLIEQLIEPEKPILVAAAAPTIVETLAPVFAAHETTSELEPEAPTRLELEVSKQAELVPARTVPVGIDMETTGIILEGLEGITQSLLPAPSLKPQTVDLEETVVIFKAPVVRPAVVKPEPEQKFKPLATTKQHLNVTAVNDRCCFPKKLTREIQAARKEEGKAEMETKVKVEEREQIKTAGNDKKVVFSVDNHQTAALKISRVSRKLRDNIKEAGIIPTGTIPIYKVKWPKMKPAEIPEWVWQGTAAAPDEIIDWPWFLVTMFYALLNTKVLLNEKIS